uniref:Uncharacterized protein n=1 Tax=Rhizophora mucronata TaxID=61149 RepID=A0A2P2PGL5_RHIMU
MKSRARFVARMSDDALENGTYQNVDNTIPITPF